MTNSEKFVTAQERADAFYDFCNGVSICSDCPLADGHERNANECRFDWLDLEAEEKPEPCPFCGKKFVAVISSHGAHEGQHSVECYNREDKCCCSGPWKDTEAAAMAAHNRVAKAVKESN